MPTITLEELDGRLLSRLELNADFYGLTERVAAINEAIRTINLLTGFLQTTENLLTQAGRPIYDVPAGLLLPLRCKFEGRALEKTTLGNLSTAHPRWLKETSTTEQIPVTNWACIGISKFALWPADAEGGGVVELTGIAEPVSLVNYADSVALPNEFSDAVEDLAAMICMFKAGGLVSVQAMQLFQRFQHRVGEMKRYKAKINSQFFLELEGAGRT